MIQYKLQNRHAATHILPTRDLLLVVLGRGGDRFAAERLFSQFTKHAFAV